MIHPPLAQIEAADPATVFLALRWNEFFDPYTIDSFQPKLCNLPILLEEILEVCETSNRHESSLGHLASLQAELEMPLKSAEGRRWISSFDAWKLDELRKSRTCADAEKIAKVLLGDGFKGKFEESIIAEIGKLPTLLPTHKESSDLLLGQLATIALNRGYSGIENTEAANKLLEKSPGQWVEGLLSRLQSRPQEYLVALELVPTPRLKGDRLAKVMEKGGFKVEDPADFPTITLQHGGVLVSVLEEGISPVASLQAVIRQVEPILDMLDFYLADRAAALPASGWVGKIKQEMVLTSVPSQSLRLVHPHRYADRLVIEALESGAGGRLDGSVRNALELHSAAMHSTDVRTRFLNLWAALECLASLVDESTISRRVTALVCPVVTWRKMEKIGRYLAINLHLWCKELGMKNTGKGNPEFSAAKIIDALCKPTKHADILRLFEMAGKHELLRYRIHSSWKAFNDPGVLAKNLADSREHLAWHLKRIYRARNLLVHRGIEVPRLEGLCDNLHYYVSMLLSRVIHGVSRNQRWKPDEAVKHWQLMGNYVIEQLSNRPHLIVLEDLMPATAADVAVIHPWGHLPGVTKKASSASKARTSEGAADGGNERISPDDWAGAPGTSVAETGPIC